jgi:phosphoglycolate phosphatase
VLQRFDLIAFDWDGTLIDSTPTIARCIQQAAADLDLGVPDFELASHVIGLGLQDALARAVPELPPERLPEFSARYRIHYLAQENELEMFEGARELVQTLRELDLRLAIATGKSHAGLARAMASVGLAGFFDATRCADQTHPKPHPAMLLELTDELGVGVDRTLMIGDTTHDLQMAKAARTHAAGVTYGAHPRDQLAACEPMKLATSVADLRQWLIPA